MPRPKDPDLDVICSQCGKKFHTTRQRMRNSKAGYFCSTDCFHAYRKEHGYNKPPPKKADPSKLINCTCVQCGKQFERKSYHIRPKYGPFCSHACYGKWRSENLIGEDSPGWKGGHSLDYGSSRWKDARRKARKRDSYTCQDCGVTEQEWGYELDVHHIIPFDMFDDPKEANDLGNLVTLCRQCHTNRHNGK